MATSPKPGLTIGLISDTHGLLRPEALRALSDVDHIIHAGDIGGPEILTQLRSIAPVDAVRGNNDHTAWAIDVPTKLHLQLGGVSVYVLHDLKDLAPGVATKRGFQVVVAGHSHRPSVAERDGVLYVNPGSAGPRRFSLPVTIAYLEIAPPPIAAGAASSLTAPSARARIREIL